MTSVSEVKSPREDKDRAKLLDQRPPLPIVVAKRFQLTRFTLVMQISKAYIGIRSSGPSSLEVVFDQPRV